MSKPASNQRWWSWQRRLSLLESLSLESFAVQFADVWISLASGLPALPSPRATIACDKAATSCAGQCSGNGICESEAIALLHFELSHNHFTCCHTGHHQTSCLCNLIAR